MDTIVWQALLKCLSTNEKMTLPQMHDQRCFADLNEASKQQIDHAIQLMEFNRYIEKVPGSVPFEWQINFKGLDRLKTLDETRNLTTDGTK